MSQYIAQANRVADEIGLKVSIEKAAKQIVPDWSEDRNGIAHHGTKYRVTLKCNGEAISFDFWGSIKDKEEGKTPSIYDVLSCVSSDMNMPTTADEVRQEIGSDMKPYQCKAIAAFAKKLQAFFTSSQRDALSEIS